MTKTEKVFVHSLDYYINDDTGRPEVVLNCRTKDGKSLEVIDKYFYPYFYLKDPTKYDKVVLSDYDAKIVETKVLKYYGKKLNCAKIETVIPRDVRELRLHFDSMERTVFSADIIYTLRYWYDKNLEPFCEITYNNDYYISHIKTCEPFDVNLKILSFDIETSIRTEEVFCISTVTENKTKTFTRDNGEAQMITDFCEYVEAEDPDIITGYNIFGFDIPVLKDAGKRARVPFFLGRGGAAPWKRENKRGKFDIWFCDGRVLVDTWQQVNQELKPPRETLDFVSNFLGFGGKDDIDSTRIEEEWVNRREEVIKYCEKDAKLCIDILNHPKVASVSKALAIAVACKLPISETFMPRSSTLIDSLLVRKMDEEGYAIPMNTFSADAPKIKGAVVFDAISGLHNNVCIADYKSMYPSIIIHYNICPTTYRRRRIRKERYNYSPLGARFATAPMGILPTILKDLWVWRDKIKELVKEPDDYNDRLQYSIKIIMNSFYGVFASSFYRFTNPEIGGSVTAYARKHITNLKDVLEEKNITVLSGDSDSIFIDLKNVGDPFKMAKELSTDEMTLEVEKVFSTYFNHGVKKRYAAKIEWPVVEDKFYVRGYELRRGDTFGLQRKALRRALELILENKPNDAFVFVSTIVKDIREGSFELNDLVITKSVKAEKEYKFPARIIGLRAAKKMLNRGIPWIPGTKVSWLVTNAKISPMDVEPYIEGEDVKIDREYYAGRIISTLTDIAKALDWDRLGVASGTQPTKVDV